jgi:hypothetical protein
VDIKRLSGRYPGAVKVPENEFVIVSGNDKRKGHAGFRANKRFEYSPFQTLISLHLIKRPYQISESDYFRQPLKLEFIQYFFN